MKTYSFLALGDSYTIGEAVLLHLSFPYQSVQMLRNLDYSFSAPEIIAKTGWRTDELLAAIENHTSLFAYDFVTLLIGVNNQYQNRRIEEYKIELEELLQKAIYFADEKKESVILISIPDYSVTPFAAAMDKEKISKEIKSFNNVGKALAHQYQIHYIDITEGSKMAQHDARLVASDGLHPSEKEYQKWAKKVVAFIANNLKE